MELDIHMLVGQAICAFIAIFIVQVGLWIWKDVMKHDNRSPNRDR